MSQKIKAEVKPEVLQELLTSKAFKDKLSESELEAVRNWVQHDLVNDPRFLSALGKYDPTGKVVGTVKGLGGTYRDAKSNSQAGEVTYIPPKGLRSRFEQAKSGIIPDKVDIKLSGAGIIAQFSFKQGEQTFTTGNVSLGRSSTDLFNITRIEPSPTVLPKRAPVPPR